jgi:ribonuclease BN (tRNA processing enzyme)
MPKLFFIFFLTFSIIGNVFAQEARDTTNIKWVEGYLDIHHINTGRGVATFMVMPDGTKMVIDLGDMNDVRSKGSLPLTVTAAYPDKSKNSGEWVIDYINQVVTNQKNPEIDYALLTHFHGDHYGIIRDGLVKSKVGDYYLSGLTQLGDVLKIKNWIDRDYPNYNYPIDLKDYLKTEFHLLLIYHFQNLFLLIVISCVGEGEYIQEEDEKDQRGRCDVILIKFFSLNLSLSPSLFEFLYAHYIPIYVLKNSCRS